MAELWIPLLSHCKSEKNFQNIYYISTADACWFFSFKEVDADWIGNEVINSVGADGDERGEWGAEMPL